MTERERKARLRSADNRETDNSVPLTSRDTCLKGILVMRGMGKDLWKDEVPDQYVRRLREGWE